MQYTPEQKADALDLLSRVGKAEAARQLGIPAGTIAAWGSRCGVAAPVELPERRALLEARSLTIGERKATLAEDLAKLSSKAVAKLIERIDNDDIGGRELVAALGHAIDRLQLLTGDATSRPEVLGGAEPAQRTDLRGVVLQLAEKSAA